ncbi:MAG: hypothetical protein MUC60_08955 [Oscillatoria sp. Prado101]|nr:hypothetical protein [Oscillatoria sp. Prado101]
MIYALHLVRICMAIRDGYITLEGALKPELEPASHARKDITAGCRWGGGDGLSRSCCAPASVASWLKGGGMWSHPS